MDFFRHRLFDKFNYPVNTQNLEKYLKTIQYNHQNNLSARLINNTPTFKSKDLISNKQTTASYFNEQSKTFQDLIRNDTDQFNRMMQSQYKELDYSYYYVQSSNPGVVYLA